MQRKTMASRGMAVLGAGAQVTREAHLRVAKLKVGKVKCSFLLLGVRMLLVAMPGAPSSVLAPSSMARSP